MEFENVKDEFENSYIVKEYQKKTVGGHVAPHGGRAAPLAAGARLIAAPTPRRRHLARRETALHRSAPKQTGGRGAAAAAKTLRVSLPPKPPPIRFTLQTTLW